MNTSIPDLACAECGSNRFMFPKSTADSVTCDDCGTPVASLGELQEKIANGNCRRESRDERLQRHVREVAESHEQLRASVAETDRLIVASNQMIKRHRQEDRDADD